MNYFETAILGCYLFELNVQKDVRGNFIKTYNSYIYNEIGIDTNWQEQYYTTSQKNVLRGMHFQLPPHEHNKLVTCITGEVLDVIVDLRKASDTFQKVVTVDLSGDHPKAVYIPKGLAHGFFCLADNSIMMYNTSTVYAHRYEAGILWSSIDFRWPCFDPILSERDKLLLPIDEFENPF